MDHKLHTAAFVEESLGDHGLLSGHRAKNCAARDDVFDRLLGACVIEAAFDLQPANSGDDFWRSPCDREPVSRQERGS